jgi:hypothetical protein
MRHRDHLPRAVLDILRDGAVIPAHPLALDAERRLDQHRQRALTRYYLDAGARGLARRPCHAIRHPRGRAL